MWYMLQLIVMNGPIDGAGVLMSYLFDSQVLCIEMFRDFLFKTFEVKSNI